MLLTWELNPTLVLSKSSKRSKPLSHLQSLTPMPDNYLVSFLNPGEPLSFTVWKRGNEYGYLSIGPDHQEQDVFKKHQKRS